MDLIDMEDRLEELRDLRPEMKTMPQELIDLRKAEMKTLREKINKLNYTKNKNRGRVK
jgi:hypothetical protein